MGLEVEKIWEESERRKYDTILLYENIFSNKMFGFCFYSWLEFLTHLEHNSNVSFRMNLFWSYQNSCY